MTAATYSINLTDSDSTPAWLSLCATATPGAQDSGRVRYTVTTEQPAALEAALDADDAVLEYARTGTMSTRTPTITITTTAYDGNDFPEAARYPRWLADQLAAEHPNAVVEVEVGPSQIVQARWTEDDQATEAAIRALLPDLWEQFCAYGYQTV